MRYYTFLILFILTIYSCSNSNESCDYKTTTVQAEVIDILPYKKGEKELFHVKLKFNKTKLYKDFQFLEDLKSIEIDSAFLKRNKVKEGVIYTGSVSEITSGKCEPLFVSFDQKLR